MKSLLANSDILRRLLAAVVMTAFSLTLPALATVASVAYGAPEEPCSHSLRNSKNSRPSWSNSAGIERSRFFENSDSSLTILMTVKDWESVNFASDRELAVSPMSILLKEDQLTAEYSGQIAGRGKSQFYTTENRPLHLSVGGKKLRVNLQSGGLKAGPGKPVGPVSLDAQKSRLRMEFSAYKIFEILHPELAMRVRWAEFEIKNENGKNVYSGGGYFEESDGLLAKRLGKTLGLELVMSNDSAYNLETVVGAPVGDLFRQFVLDRDYGNAFGNFRYFATKSDTLAFYDNPAHTRVIFDFDNISINHVPDDFYSKSDYQTDLQKNVKFFKAELDVELNKILEGYEKQANKESIKAELRAEIDHYLKCKAQILALLEGDKSLTPAARALQLAWYGASFEAIAEFKKALISAF